MLNTRKQSSIEDAIRGLQYLEENNGGFLIEIDEADLYLQNLVDEEGYAKLVTKFGGVPPRYEAQYSTKILDKRSAEPRWFSKLFSFKK